jgi:hypothetical protein
MTRPVQWRGGPEHRIGEIVRLPDGEAAAAIAAGVASGVTAVRFLTFCPPYNPGDIAGLPDGAAARALALDWVELVPPEPDAEASKGLEHPPGDRMIHRAPITKEAKP